MSNIITVKIKTDDVIKSIDNLESLELIKLNNDEYKSYLKYAKDTVIEDYDEYINSEKYQKIVKYIKDNDISGKLIKKYEVKIYDYFFKNDKINFKEIKEFIINLEKIPDPSKLSPEFHEYLIENKAKVGLGSGLTADIDDSLSPEIQSLRCVIKMTEYTPISGGNLSEFNKIPELFIKKKNFNSVKK